MNWYYAEQGHRKGPVGQAELDEMVSTRALPTSALVWCEGMTDWKPYSTLRAPAPTLVPAPGLSGDPIFVPQAGTCVCCGRYVAPQESVVIGEQTVCPDCKPVYVERWREADLPSLPGGMPYSGFWIRFVARMADYTLLTIVQVFLTGTVLTWVLKRKMDAGDAFSLFGLTTLAGLCLSGIYETTMVATRGATLGKMLCYLRVVHADGSAVGVGTSLGRFFAGLLSRFSAGAGLLMAGFDIEKRALHDRIVGTRVIDVPPTQFNRKELQPVAREIRCGQCDTEFPLGAWNAGVPLPCPGCSTPMQAIVFPAVTRTLPASLPHSKEGEGEAGCYYHDANRATTTCEECGRFLCPLCELDAGARRLCPNCFNAHVRGGQTAEFVQRRTLYDSIALIGAVLPNLFLITIYLTFLTAPAVVGFSIWSWRKEGSLTPRTRSRYVLALLIAGVNILFVVVIIFTLLVGVFK